MTMYPRGHDPIDPINSLLTGHLSSGDIIQIRISHISFNNIEKQYLKIVVINTIMTGNDNMNGVLAWSVTFESQLKQPDKT